MRRTAAAAWLALGCAWLRPAPPEDAFRARPYVFAREGRVELSSCRWSLAQPLEVALARGASAEEETALAATLGAYARGMRELRFVRVPHHAALVVRFVDGVVTDAAGMPSAGRTLADCRLGAAGARTALVSASLEVARTVPPDWLGRVRTATLAERTGALAHELAHALGAPGHAADPHDPLVGSPAALRALGERILAGEPIESAGLRALYARPSGELLGSVEVEGWRTIDIDRLRRLAETRRFDGPYLRASDRVGRIFWRDLEGQELGFLVAGLDELAAEPRRLLLLAEPATRALLPRQPGP